MAALAWRYGRRVRWAAVAVLLLLAAFSAVPGTDQRSVAEITVASRDIPSGAQLGADDLAPATTDLPLPATSSSDLMGQTTRGPIAAGEPITPSRIVPGGTVAPQPGTIVFPLTLSDERVAALLHSGDRVDVMVTPDALHDGEPRLVASDVEVLGVPVDSGAGFDSPQSGAVVLLAVPESDASQLAVIRRGDRVFVAIR